MILVSRRRPGPAQLGKLELRNHLVPSPSGRFENVNNNMIAIDRLKKKCRIPFANNCMSGAYHNGGVRAGGAGRGLGRNVVLRGGFARWGDQPHNSSSRATGVQLTPTLSPLTSTRREGKEKRHDACRQSDAVCNEST